jgi:phage gp36-like protein
MIPSPFLVQALDDSGVGSINPEVWNQIAQDTADEIDGQLGKRYPVPFTPPFPPLVIRAAKLIAVDRIYKRRGQEKNPYQQEIENVRKELESVATGAERLTYPGTSVEGSPATAITLPSRLGGSLL